jgi:dipicolinate synthase subunit A
MNIAVIGGDDRLAYAARELSGRGYTVSAFSLSLPVGGAVRICKSADDAVRDANAVALPIPIGAAYIKGTDSLSAEELLPYMRKDSVLLGGNLPASLLSAARHSGIRTSDYLTHEPFVLKNAYLTAQGALGILLRELPFCLYRTPIAMLGFGRIAKFLARMLVSLGADVTVFARRETDRTMASLIGMSARSTDSLADPAALSRFRAVVNTAPAKLLRRENLYPLAEGTLLLELASGSDNLPEPPAGSGIRRLLAHSLPGRCYPMSAGEIVADATEALIRHTLSEKNGR